MTAAPEPVPPERPEPVDEDTGEFVSLDSAVMSPALLLFLYLVTLGFYTPILAFRFSRVLREPGRPAWFWSVGSLIPCLNLWIVYRMAQELEARAARTAISTVVSPRTTVGLLVVALVVGAGFRRSDNYLLVLVGVAIACLPFLGMQQLLNRLARQEAGLATLRRKRPWFSFALIPIGLLVHAYLIWDSRALWHRARGDAVAAGETVQGNSGVYGIKVPRDGWVRVKPGTVGDPSSDLELFGPNVSTSAIVYLYDDVNQTLDGRVDERRRIVHESGGGELHVQEERFFHNATDLVPASITRYETEHQITWVATFDLRPRFVEVLVITPRVAGYDGDAERMVRTVQLTLPEQDSEAPASGSRGAVP